MRRWVCAVVALVAQAGCQCGGRVTQVLEPGGAYGGSAAGATVSQSPNFKLVGAVDAPAGVTARSPNFELRGGVVGATQQ